jgi:hypothetical protein
LGDGIGRNVWTDAGAWQSLACGGGGAALGKFLNLPVEDGGNEGLLAGGEPPSLDPANLPRPC